MKTEKSVSVFQLPGEGVQRKNFFTLAVHQRLLIHESELTGRRIPRLDVGQEIVGLSYANFLARKNRIVESQDVKVA